MITIYKGSILDVKADYIVNPANSFLAHGGGLARIIDVAATTVPEGLTMVQEGQIKHKIDEYIEHRGQNHHVATGTAILGPPGVLPYEGIIHAVGPIYHDGKHHELELLGLVYQDVLRIFDEQNGQSIAMPAMGAGIFDNPIEDVAQAAVAVVDDFMYDDTYYPDRDYILALMTDDHVNAFAEMCEEYYLDYKVENAI